MAFIRADIFSDALGMATTVNVVIPEGKPSCEWPVVTLLHGLSDNCSMWERRTSVERYAENVGCAVVMPEVQRSFYTDMKFGIKYFTYITEDLPRLMHMLFNLSTDREKNYIAGLSMGGFGALKCGLTYPDRYAGIAAFSAVCDMQGSIDRRVVGGEPELEEMKAIFGLELKAGEENDLFSLAEKTAAGPKRPRIFQSCGTSDFLYQQNQKMKALLETLPLDYHYVEWEDGHCWPFWDISIQLAFDFFFDLKNEEA